MKKVWISINISKLKHNAPSNKKNIFFWLIVKKLYFMKTMSLRKTCGGVLSVRRERRERRRRPYILVSVV